MNIEKIIEKLKKEDIYRFSFDTYPNGDPDYDSIADEIGEYLRKIISENKHYLVE